MTTRWAFMRRFDILDADGGLYLRRWRIVQTPWFAIYLHKIARSDKDRDLHDHPWSFVSLILRGGYDEVLDGAASWFPTTANAWAKPVRRRWLSLSFRRATDAHRILRLHRTPTWTLVLTGPRRRDWGFYIDGKGFVDWRTYLGVAEVREGGS